MINLSEIDNKKKALFAILIGALVAGALPALTKIGLREVPPLTFAFLRFLLALVFLIPYILKQKWRDYVIVFPLSVLATLNIALFVLGIQTTTATISQLLYAGTPLITALISYRLLKSENRNEKILGIIIGFIGTFVILLLPVIEGNRTLSGDIFGNMLIAGGVILYSFYLSFSKKAQAKYSPLFITSSFILSTVFVLFPFFIWETLNSAWFQNISTSGVLSILYAGLLGTLVPYYLTQYTVKHGGAVFASLSFYLIPIFAFLMAFILLGESLTAGILIGGVLALLGVYLATR